MNFKQTKSTKACGGCPFKRVNTNEKPNPGGSHPFVYIGQTRGPFWLPCHKDKNYQGHGSNPETVSQCRGAAIFRSNCEVPYNLPEPLLSLEKDTESVFANEAEFLQHYLDIDDETAKNLSSEEALNMMMDQELYKKSATRREYKQ
jgi:hypothetical protein